MTTDNFPEHFDGSELNPEGVVPETLPLEFANGKCTYQIDAEHVHILNKSDEDDDRMQWSEPLASYDGVRHWVIVEQSQEEKRGILGKLFGGVKPVEQGPRHSVIGLAHNKEPWMSVVLFSRELSEGEDGAASEEIAVQYRRLFDF